MADDDLLSTTEVARIFKVDIKTVARWAQRGQIPALRTPGGRLRFRRSDIDTVLTRPGRTR